MTLDFLQVLIVLWYILMLPLAANAMSDVWFYGDIFQRPRNYFKSKTGFFAELLSCEFCLAYHIVLTLVLLTVVPVVFLPSPWCYAGALPVAWLAAVDVLHRLQDYEADKQEWSERDDDA